ncbi:alpha-L-fucosidase [Polaribacter haliotis]|uniref:alpha-L-fucosidase n=2 Tax=Polaribacter haliotis TaxID=1888915 RepID=A0A7L8AKZ7_9FLAO|nr:alpha-L-fucosidase [Polaribacter haliotis]
MNEMWGSQKVKSNNSLRGKNFIDGNYAMFIHWGLYSQLANKWKGKTYYGIGEWLMHKDLAGVPADEYMEVAKDFNPTKFDADAFVSLAKNAGMKYIIITSKHHDGFAMFDTKVSDFNVVKATPYGKDLMKQLAEACKKQEMGFGFYYSHNQDWTEPGGNGGPKTNAKGEAVTFDDYFKNKCLPQVIELTKNYGDIELIWFDTPGNMPKKYVEELVQVVRKYQPKALVSGRAGHGLGDYTTLGDMEIPNKNHEGLWETVDVINDSWGYAWYDQNWKTPKDILERLISTVARGGTYMVNIGPKGDGTIPIQSTKALLNAGKWIKKYPNVVYGAEASPWKHKLPWGDVTKKGNSLYLSIYKWPIDGELYLPGLQSNIESCTIQTKKGNIALKVQKINGWTKINLPSNRPEKLVSVVTLKLNEPPKVISTLGIDPVIETELLAEFATASDAKKDHKYWMEKFGEWKATAHIHSFKEYGKAYWKVDVLKPGYYQVELDYAGEGRLVWSVETDDNEQMQNQQNSSQIYAYHSIGWLKFKKSGKHKIAVSLVEGNAEKASLRAIKLIPVVLD